MKNISIRRYNWILLFLFIAGIQSTHAQTFCETTPGPGAIGNLSGDVLPGSFSGPYLIRIYVHVVRRSDGTGGQTPENVREALSYLDQDFNPHGIFFVWDCEIDYIDSDFYYAGAALSIFFQNANNDGIDIYLQPDEPTGAGPGQGRASGIPGDAFYIFGSFWNPPYNFLVRSHAISHEMAHCLGLYHTHQGSPNDPFTSSEFCEELVNQSNCITCGDYVCDTPADPYMNYNMVAPDCEWLGSYTDPNGAPSNPDERNIMAYTHLDCMQYFTKGQGERMRQMIAFSSILQDCLVDPDLIHPEIAVNTTWTPTNTPNNGNFIISGDLEIKSGATLTINTGVTVHFAEDSRLIIKPNGRLALYGTLTSMGCGVTWKGIEVWGNSGASQAPVSGV
jgi:hypothetical protein